MKYVLLVVIVALSFAAYAQQPTYAEWQEEAKQNIRLLPEYGHVPKTDGQKAADETFIQTSLKTDTTARKASDHLVQLGFTYFNRGDIKTAMYRFNQAWLMDPTNANIYWGFGGIYFHFGDLDMADSMYNRGLAIDPNSTNILTDKATIFMSRIDKGGDISLLNNAIDLFLKSYTIDPHNANTTFKLSACYLYLNDCKNARRYYEECKKDGGQPITDDYTKSLNDACK